MKLYNELLIRFFRKEEDGTAGVIVRYAGKEKSLLSPTVNDLDAACDELEVPLDLRYIQAIQLQPKAISCAIAKLLQQWEVILAAALGTYWPGEIRQGMLAASAMPDYQQTVSTDSLPTAGSKKAARETTTDIDFNLQEHFVPIKDYKADTYDTVIENLIDKGYISATSRGTFRWIFFGQKPPSHNPPKIQWKKSLVELRWMVEMLLGIVNDEDAMVVCDRCYAGKSAGLLHDGTYGTQPLLTAGVGGRRHWKIVADACLNRCGKSFTPKSIGSIRSTLSPAEQQEMRRQLLLALSPLYC